MSLKVVFISVAITFANNINNTNGIRYISVFVNCCVVIKLGIATIAQLKYATHFTGLHTFVIAPKYSCIATIAISVNNNPIIILFCINSITASANPTINPDVILFKSISLLSLLFACSSLFKNF